MSGPIIRKYGFPNYDKIFGKKELAHGVEGADVPTAEAQIAKAAGASSSPDSPPSGSSSAKPSTNSNPSQSP